MTLEFPPPRLQGYQPEGEVDVSIVVPAYNEEGAIGQEIDRLHEELGQSELRYEVIVVDDGSRDRTYDVASDRLCKVLRLPQNRGYGAALKRGIASARSEYVVITDADGTYPASAIPEMFRMAAHHDMVVGARTGKDVHVPLLRRPAKAVLRMLAAYLAGYPIPDLNSGLRLMRRTHVRRFAHILPNGFSFTTTITLALLCNELSVGYLPINYGTRIGNSKIRAKHAYVFMLLILRTIVLFNPLKIFLPLGAILFLAGLAKFAYDVTLDNLSESAVLAILGAIVVWAIGLLADQNSRLGMDRDAWNPNQ